MSRREFHLVWDSWNDGMMSKEVKQVKVIEVLSIKEVTEGRDEVCMPVFHKIYLCNIIAGNMDKCSSS